MEQVKENYYTVALPNDKKGESAIYRYPKSKNELFKVPEEIDTYLKIFEYRVKRNGRRNYFSYNYNDLEKYGNMIQSKFSFEEMKHTSLQYMQHLVKNDCIPDIELDNKTWKFVGIYAKNTPEWLMAYVGHMYNNVTTVSIYDTLGPDGISYILQLTKLTTMVVHLPFLEKVFKLYDEGRVSNLKNLIIITDKSLDSSVKVPDLIKEKYEKYLNLFKISYMDNIIEFGLRQNSCYDSWTPDMFVDDFKVSKPSDFTSCSTNSFMLISFTSGSTGIPKGALMSHKGICNQVYSLLETHGLPSEEFEEKHFSYLPYSHIFEQVYFGFSMLRGMNTYYYSGDVKKMVDDLNSANPTFFIAVPRVLLRFYDVIKGIINSKTSNEKKLIDLAFHEKITNIRNDNNYHHFLFDKLIFDKIRQKLFGPNPLKYILVASAPIDAEVLDFFKVVLSVPIVEVYGMTEEHGALTYTSLQDCYSGHVGGPITCMEMKLVDVPELNYYTTDKNKVGQLEPRGEICSRGICVFEGYLCMPEESKEAVDKDRWLHSGDIGTMVNN